MLIWLNAGLSKGRPSVRNRRAVCLQSISNFRDKSFIPSDPISAEILKDTLHLTSWPVKGHASRDPVLSIASVYKYGRIFIKEVTHRFCLHVRVHHRKPLAHDIYYSTLQQRRVKSYQELVCNATFDHAIIDHGEL